jgi:hypothetical protein
MPGKPASPSKRITKRKPKAKARMRKSTRRVPKRPQAKENPRSRRAGDPNLKAAVYRLPGARRSHYAPYGTRRTDRAPRSPEAPSLQPSIR